jgi:hypothetical protein
LNLGYLTEGYSFGEFSTGMDSASVGMVFMALLNPVYGSEYGKSSS